MRHQLGYRKSHVAERARSERPPASDVRPVIDEASGSTPCGRHALQVRGLHEILAKTFAPIEQLFYDAVVIHGVPPDARGSSLGCHQPRLWTTYRQCTGIPREIPP
jgi:hypothetical protein